MTRNGGNFPNLSEVTLKCVFRLFFFFFQYSALGIHVKQIERLHFEERNQELLGSCVVPLAAEV